MINIQYETIKKLFNKTLSIPIKQFPWKSTPHITPYKNPQQVPYLSLSNIKKHPGKSANQVCTLATKTGFIKTDTHHGNPTV